LHVRHSTVHRMLEIATRTASGNTNNYNVSEYSEALLNVFVTGTSGTSPTMDVAFLVSGDNSYYSIHTSCFQLTAAGNQVAKLTNIGKHVKVRYNLGGTNPVFVFGIDLILKD